MYVYVSMYIELLMFMSIIIIILGPCQRTKKTGKMKVRVVQIVVVMLGMFLKNFEKRLGEWEIKERVETFTTTPLLRSTRLLRRDQDT